MSMQNITEHQRELLAIAAWVVTCAGILWLVLVGDRRSEKSADPTPELREPAATDEHLIDPEGWSIPTEEPAPRVLPPVLGRSPTGEIFWWLKTGAKGKICAPPTAGVAEPPAPPTLDVPNAPEDLPLGAAAEDQRKAGDALRGLIVSVGMEHPLSGQTISCPITESGFLCGYCGKWSFGFSPKKGYKCALCLAKVTAVHTVLGNRSNYPAAPGEVTWWLKSPQLRKLDPSAHPAPTAQDKMVDDLEDRKALLEKQIRIAMSQPQPDLTLEELIKLRQAALSAYRALGFELRLELLAMLMHEDAWFAEFWSKDKVSKVRKIAEEQAAKIPFPGGGDIGRARDIVAGPGDPELWDKNHKPTRKPE